MSLLEIERLLSHKIGIDANIIGSRKIAKAVETRCLICGVSNVKNYLQILHKSVQEFNELVELIVVPETWFFRDYQTYQAIAQYINSQWLNKLNKFSHDQLRLLSVPCSTGEEPYSLAMTLLDIGLLPHQFQIDAVDISAKSLDKAKKGIYSRNSFRGQNVGFQNRYFQAIGQEYQICNQVKKTVNFSQGNLLDAYFLWGRKAYDIILCRNVLIYFDASARATTLKRLHSLLNKEGIILVGSSETGEMGNFDWEIIRYHGVFLGRKILENTEKVSIHYLYDNPNIKETTKPLTQPINRTEAHPVMWQRTTVNANTLVLEESTANNLATPVEKHDYNLEIIRILADEGKLNEAIYQCQKYLQADSTSAEAYLLLGQVYHAQRQELQAEVCFQKAIYLDPKNSQALLHLILLKEQKGEMTTANILRQRLQRLQQ